MNRGSKFTVALVVILLALITIGVLAFSDVFTQKETLKIATTTSLEDTGLLNVLESEFEAKNPNVDVQIISAGTGQALEYGKKGDVDLVMVHSKKQEETFINDGYGTNRTIFAYNYFYIVGPENDSAVIKNISPTDAFKKIMAGGEADSDLVKFVSRGDNSGTYTRELTLWNSTGVDYNTSVQGKEWYIESGKGMGDTLILANEKSAYTLSDSGTYLAFKGNISLVALVTEGKDLINVYSLIPINPAKFSDTNTADADKWIAFVTSTEGQNIIKDYGLDKYNQTLFTPYVGTADPT